MSLPATAAAVASRLPGDAVRKLAGHVEGLVGPGNLGLGQAKDLVPTPPFRASCDALWTSWHVEPGLPGSAVAAALRAALAALEAERARLSVELVVTGPASYTVPLRQTTAVLLELIKGAEQSIWLVSFAAYKVPEVVAALAAAVERGVSVRLLLESTEGGLAFDAAPAFAAVASEAAFYRWPLDRRPQLAKGTASMHAKALVADGRRAFITSANFTGRALDNNIEVGALVNGGHLPATLAQHLDSLVEQKVLVRVN